MSSDNSKDGGWTKRYATDDKVVFLRLTETAYPRHLTVEEILKHYKDEDDDWCGNPWEDLDGFDHKKVNIDDHPGTLQDCKAERGYVNPTGWPSFVVRLLEDPDEDFRYFHQAGNSKQVAREKAARNRRRTIDQIVEWYDKGWRNVTFSISLFGRYSADVLSTFEPADSYAEREDLKHELPCEIVHELQADGFIVDDFEDYLKEHRETEARMRIERIREEWDTTPKPIYPSSVAYEYRRDLPSRRHRRFLKERQEQEKAKLAAASSGG